MAETIKIYSKDDVLIYELTPSERCKRFYQLMGEDYITLEFSEAYRPAYTTDGGERVGAIPPPAFHIGDYCDIDGERYVINGRVVPTYNKTDGSYKYSLKMVAEYRTWNSYIVKELAKDDAGEYSVASAIFKYTADLANHARLLLANMAVNGFYDVGDIDQDGLDAYIVIQAKHFDASSRDKENKLMTYDGQDVLEALERLCSAEMYDCEWWVERKGGRYYLNFGRIEGSEDAITIQTGVNASDISEERSKNDYANRIYVLGGTQNVPYSYRKKLIFTHTSNDSTRLTDSQRQLEHEMFERNARQTLYDCDRVESFKEYTQRDIKEAQAKNTAKLTIAEKYELPAGKYKLDAMAVEHKLRLSGDTYKGFVIALQYTIKGTATINGREMPLFAPRTYKADITRIRERYAHSGDEWPSAQGSISTTIIPADDNIIINNTATNVKVELLVDFTIDPTWLVLRDPSLIFELTGTGKKVFTRTDLYIADCVVTKYPTGETSHAEFQESTHWGTNVIVPDNPLALNMRNGDHYQLDSLIYNKIKQNYYTSDKGDDVINGLSEMRINLPVDATTEVGVICRNGYVEKTDTKDRIVEKLMIHDDIFPSEMSMVVQDFSTEKRPAKITFPDSSVSEREFDVWIIKDTYINNDPQNKFSKDYILDGATLQVKFKTGALAGMTFDVEFGHELKQGVQDERDEENPYTQTYLVIPNTNYGALLPNERLHPQIGDEMLLIGWDCNSISGLGMIAKAEEMLLAAALDDLDAATKGSRTYRVQMMTTTEFEQETLQDKGGNDLQDMSGETLTSNDVRGEANIKVGEKVRLKDYALFADEEGFESEPLRVIGYETALDYPFDAPQYIVGEIPKPTRRQTLESITKQLKAK